MRSVGRVTIIVAHTQHEPSGVLNPIAQRACREYLNRQFRLNVAFKSATIRTHHAVTREIIAVEQEEAQFAKARVIFLKPRDVAF